MTGADTTGVEDAPDRLGVRRAVGHEGTGGDLVKNPLGDDVRQPDLPILPEHKLNPLDVSVLGGRDYERIRRVRRPRSTGAEGGNPVSGAVETRDVSTLALESDSCSLVVRAPPPSGVAVMVSE